MPAALPGRRAPSTPRARGNCHHTKRRTPHPRRVRATLGPSCREPGSRQVFPESPAPALNGSAPRGGVRDRAGRWGPAAGGVIGGRGDPAPRLGQDGADRLDPELLLALVDVLADQRDGRSHSAAIEQADAPRPIAPPAPGSRTPDAGSPVRRAPSVVVPGRSPATDPNPPAGSRPRRVSGPAPSSSPTRRKHPQAGPGRPGRPGVNRIARPPAHRGASRVRA